MAFFLDLTKRTLKAQINDAAERLGATYKTNLTLSFTHAVDAVTAFEAAATVLAAGTEMVVLASTDEVATTVTMVFKLHNSSVLLFAFNPLSETLAYVHDVGFYVSLNSMDSRQRAVDRFCTQLPWLHYTMITDQLPVARTHMAYCQAGAVAQACVKALHVFDVGDGFAAFAAQLHALRKAGDSILLAEVHEQWFLDWITRYWAVEAEEHEKTLFIWMLSLQSPEFYSSVAALHDLNPERHYIVSPVLDEALVATYGAADAHWIAFSLDALELAARAAKDRAYPTAPLNAVLNGSRFSGYTGIVEVGAGGLRVQQQTMLWGYSGLDADGQPRVVNYLMSDGDRASPPDWNANTGSAPPVGQERVLHLMLLTSGDEPAGVLSVYEDVVAAFNAGDDDLFAKYHKTLQLSAVTRADFSNASIYSLGCLGPAASLTAQELAPVIQHVYRVPMLSLVPLTDLAQGSYPYFARIVPDSSLEAAFLAAVARLLAWADACVVYDLSLEGQDLSTYLQATLGDLAGDVHTLTDSTATSAQTLAQQVAKLRASTCLTLLFCVGGGMAPKVMEALEAQGMLKGRNVIFSHQAQLARFDPVRDLGVFFVGYHMRARDPGSGYADMIRAYATDAVKTYVRALEAMVADRANIFNGTLLHAYMMNQTLAQGSTGPVQFGGQGDRSGRLQLLNVQPAGAVVVVSEAAAEPAAAESRRAPGPAHAGQPRRAGARAAPTPRASGLTVVNPMLFAGNQSTFDNQAKYVLEWASGSPRAFLSRNDGAAIVPYPQATVRLWDGSPLPTGTTKQVFITFAPVQATTAPMVVSGNSTFTTSADSVSLVSFTEMVFTGHRGLNYTMTMRTDNGLNELQATLAVQVCEPDREYVSDYVACATCPAGAVCDGTAVLEASADYWRTGGYTEAWEYYPNEAEQRFLRCPTRSCAGGVNSSCFTGTGPFCAHCEAGAHFSVAYRRCMRCDYGRAGHLGLAAAYGLALGGILAVLVRGTMRAIGRVHRLLWTSILRIAITFAQTTALVATIVDQDPSVADARAVQWGEYLNAQGQMAWHWGCAFGVSAYWRMVFWMALPFLCAAALLLGLFAAMVAVAKCPCRRAAVRRSVWDVQAQWYGIAAAEHEPPRAGADFYSPRARDVPMRLRAPSAPPDPGDPDELGFSGSHVCMLCYRTCALYFCMECQEGLYLCGPCDRALHPKANHEAREHQRFAIEPNCRRTFSRATVVFVATFEAFRMVGPAVLQGLSRWFACSEEVCNGGACDSYLMIDTAVSCSSTGYRVMFGAVVAAMAAVAAGLPLAVVAVCAWHWRRLHQERTIAKWGWLCQAYQWPACYWEAAVMLRKYLIVFIAELDSLGVGSQLNLVTMVSVVALYLEMSVEPHLHCTAGLFERGTLLATIATTVLVNVLGDALAFQWLVCIIVVVNGAAGAALLYVLWVREPELVIGKVRRLSETVAVATLRRRSSAGSPGITVQDLSARTGPGSPKTLLTDPDTSDGGSGSFAWPRELGSEWLSIELDSSSTVTPTNSPHAGGMEGQQCAMSHRHSLPSQRILQTLQTDEKAA